MTAVWRWGVACGVVIVVVDLIAALVSSGQSSTSPQLNVAQSVDLVVNFILYSFCGYRVGLLTREMRAAAEGGVIAGVLVGIAAIIVGQLVPPALDGEPLSPIAAIAENVALGGVLALASGFVASRTAQVKR